MIDWAIEHFLSVSPIIQALYATTFTWLVTAAGASLVFFVKSLQRKLLDGMLGFTGGVMVAASYWSLLAPAIEISEFQGHIPWLAPAIVFLTGPFFLFGLA